MQHQHQRQRSRSRCKLALFISRRARAVMIPFPRLLSIHKHCFFIYVHEISRLDCMKLPILISHSFFGYIRAFELSNKPKKNENERSKRANQKMMKRTRPIILVLELPLRLPAEVLPHIEVENPPSHMTGYRPRHHDRRNGRP